MSLPFITFQANIPIDSTAQTLADAHRILRDEMITAHHELPIELQAIRKLQFDNNILRINVLIGIIKLMYPKDSSTPIPTSTPNNPTTIP